MGVEPITIRLQEFLETSSFLVTRHKKAIGSTIIKILEEPTKGHLSISFSIWYT
jgi:hypothetical protein